MPFPYTFPFPLGAVGLSTEDHDAGARARVVTALKETTVEDLVGVLATSSQSTEEGIWTLRRRRLSAAEGAQLDGIGRIVGQLRGGVSDVEYRLRLKARIRINRSAGRADEDLYGVVGVMINSAISMELREEFPAAFRMILTGGDVPNAAIVNSLMQEAKAAGVGAQLLHTNDEPASTFTLDGAAGQGLDEGILADLLE